MSDKRDHGGNLDAAIRSYGGARADWIDLSTGINPAPYPIGDIPPHAWQALPDRGALDRLIQAARQFWSVPDDLAIVAAPGASALIARMPDLWPQGGTVRIDTPTYNEHAAAFRAQGWQGVPGAARVRVVVHPNNPTGAFWDGEGQHDALVVDESFCDVAPERSLIGQAGPGTLILKSFGKFWGLAGVRLGFAIGDPTLVARMQERLGPWAVAGPALEIGARALADRDWAARTRAKLDQDAARLDGITQGAGALCLGGTSLFRLYQVDDAAAWQDRLARHHIWSRRFPYSRSWLRLGLPPKHGWSRLEAAL